ncbi:unnamed protein product (macronuclear) [Paramecium tetraurelia]|uniref:SPX domain-containing protein n=1 Tax=Paramecium tetraurelia TaxID=5888 RepID=A0CH94_PARTE|nr:uncharacterized protein GSPATT00007601001 [Paramecium tetraurelia]CAK70161.1 unnamed protein product [Paramecium tetraurelia]|eukprot:XP_001437558.1 hypothetical protein (macronuclear) [Paramecium tetraurelia strain d4-2]
MNMQCTISKEILRCETPSTDETNYDIIEQQCYLTQIIELIFVENYTYKELQQYFTYTFQQIEQYDFFFDQIYKSVRIYMEKILQHIKQFSQITKPIDIKHLKDYVTIIRELEKSYKVTQLKHKELQEVVKSFSHKEKISQSIHCLRLMKYSFTNIVLRNKEVNDFLISLKQVLDKKFYSQTQIYSKTKERLQLFIQLLNEKQQDCLSYYDDTKQQRPSITISTTNNNENAPLIVQNSNLVGKKGQQESNTKLNEYKKFEQNLEEYFQAKANIEKKEINVSQEWINRLKQKTKKK